MKPEQNTTNVPASLGLKSFVLLFLAALIWGFAFVAQKTGMHYVGPFTFNGIRFIMGSITLLPLLIFLKRTSIINPNQALIFSFPGGILAGTVLFIAASLQQIGIMNSTAGNAGFITSLYVILVPVFGLIWKQKTTWMLWAGAILAITGLFFLTNVKAFYFTKGDGLILVSAIFFAFHVLIIGRLASRANAVILSIMQFAVCGTLSLILAFIREKIIWDSIVNAWIPLLYGGIMSVGVAFTFQVVAQKNVHPAYAAIILSLESLFAAIGGWIMLDEHYTFTGLLGAALMLSGVILSQLRPEKINR